eukprot:Gb_16680 [translate_table: standard]
MRKGNIPSYLLKQTVRAEEVQCEAVEQNGASFEWQDSESSQLEVEGDLESVHQERYGVCERLQMDCATEESSNQQEPMNVDDRIALQNPPSRPLIPDLNISLILDD